MTKEVKIKPRCLTFPMTDPEHMPAAYTSDGYMLPCCWLDQPELDDDVKKMGLRNENLALKNNSKLEDIYSSKEWTNFFDIVVNKPEKAMNYCQYKCGNAKWIPKT